jgi:hypothetical protein
LITNPVAEIHRWGALLLDKSTKNTLELFFDRVLVEKDEHQVFYFYQGLSS